MALEALIARLRGNAATPATPHFLQGLQGKPLPILGCTPETPDTPKNSKAGKKTEPGHSRQAETEKRLTRPYISEVSGVSRVQPSIGGACADTPAETDGVSGVSRRDERHALAAEPIEPGRRQPGAPLAGDQEAAIRAWLVTIGETDQATIAEVLTWCRQDEDVRRYFGRAGEIPADDRRRCNQCGNLHGAVCIIAKPGGVVSAIVGYRPVQGIPQRCAGYKP
jgi:hypothetical protein